MSNLIIRKIQWYDKERRSILGEETLKNLSINDIREILRLDYDPEDPDLDCVYDISKEASIKLQSYIEHRFNLDEYGYSLACCYQDWSAELKERNLFLQNCINSKAYQEMKVVHKIHWFDKETEILVDDEEFTNLSIEDIRKILKLDYDLNDPELFEEYTINEKEGMCLQPHIKHQFNFDRYNYQLGSSQEWSDELKRIMQDYLNSKEHSITKETKKIQWFDKETKCFVGEEILKILSVDDVRKILWISYDSNNHELHNVDNISKQMSRKLQPYINHQFDFDKYDYRYYLDCYQG